MTDKSPAGDPSVPPDPIYQKSYSVPIALASIALVGSVAYAIAQEAWLLRPYKPIQAQWKDVTLTYLTKLEKERTDFDGALRLLDEFKSLNDEAAKVDAETKDVRERLQAEFVDLDHEVASLKDAIKVHRSEISALTYDAEHAAHGAFESGETETADPLKSPAAKSSVDGIKAVEARKISYTWKRSTGEVVVTEGVAGELIQKFVALQGAKGRKQQEVGVAFAPKSAADKARDGWIAKNLGSIKQFLEAPRPTLDADGNPSGTQEPTQLRAAVAKRVAEVGASRYVDDYVTVVSPSTVARLREKMERFQTGPLLGGEIQTFQIHVKETNNWVDRCEVCHLGARSVVPMTEESLRDAAADAKWPASKIESTKFSLFKSHPRAGELFAKHDPDKMGCSTCHNGNGIGIITTELAHGQNHDWLWPLFPKDNIEAGCVQCHQGDVHLAGGPRISQARETFMDKGCWGCHPYQGYDHEVAELTKTEGRIKELKQARIDKAARAERIKDLVNSVDDDAALNRISPPANADRDALTEQIAQIDTEVQLAERTRASLYDERIRVGPNLKDVKVKWRPEVLTDWVQNPEKVKPESKMPVFRWFGDKDEFGLFEEAKDVAAFIWQSAHSPEEFPEYRLTAPQGGSAGRGKQVFEKVGCLSCHGIEQDGKRIGGTFASNLTNVGDKLTYEYAFRWIKAPRHRLVPYSPKLGKDLTKAEYEKEDPATLVWRQPTRMPDLRLADDDARDVATYLTQLRSDTKWPTPTWLTDTKRFENGKKLAVYSGCAGCHEIRGLESERGIGTELTKEGTKPLDRLDFGHLTTDAKRGHEPLEDWTTTDGHKVFAKPEGHGEDAHHGGWYNSRGYFMHKLAKPDLYDTSKYFADRTLRSRMPKFRLTKDEIQDLTTFLLGSVDSRIPGSSMYQPDEAGQAIRDGWWIVKRYNCEGCHTAVPGQVPSFQQLPWWAPDEKRDRVFPPTLVGEGFRVRPDWIAGFLHDPSLGGGTDRPKALRRHLDVRMPTFWFTDDEVAKLVRYFEAMAKQPFVYQPPKVGALSATEKKLAEAIWSPKGMNCLQCHLAEGKETPDAETKAPHLGFAKHRLKPEWMARWIPKPVDMQPWTAMTSNFVRETPDDPHSRWIYMTPMPEFEGVSADHVDLMIRWVYGLPDAPK
ncbi:MAG: cytochrome c [Planctomycetes bacterium]|nr:cytochrome c [Planctomycetota bacterium]